MAIARRARCPWDQRHAAPIISCLAFGLHAAMFAARRRRLVDSAKMYSTATDTPTRCGYFVAVGETGYDGKKCSVEPAVPAACPATTFGELTDAEKSCLLLRTRQTPAGLAGLPEGFMVSRSMGDVAVLGLLLPIGMICLDGRGRFARAIAFSWAFVLLPSESSSQRSSMRFPTTFRNCSSCTARLR